MKNLVRTIVPLVIGAAIGFFVCKQYFCEKPDCPECPPNTTTVPSGIISVNKAVNLHETYKESRYQVINETIGGQTDSTFLDTQFVWFEYEKIKNYIAYLETVERKNPNNPEISGIRVYFGAYDSTNPEYPQQQTVFFNPTIKTELEEDNNNMKNLPFYILPDTANEPLVGKYKVIQRLLLDEYNDVERAFIANSNLGHEETSENMVQKSAITNAKNGGDGTSLSFNIGHLSPPPPRG